MTDLKSLKVWGRGNWRMATGKIVGQIFVEQGGHIHGRGLWQKPGKVNGTMTIIKKHIVAGPYSAKELWMASGVDGEIVKRNGRYYVER